MILGTCAGVTVLSLRVCIESFTWHTCTTQTDHISLEGSALQCVMMPSNALNSFLQSTVTVTSGSESDDPDVTKTSSQKNRISALFSKVDKMVNILKVYLLKCQVQ